MIGVAGLGKAFGQQTLFEDVTLQLEAGRRYGLVGANGSGKTTFLRILSGDEPPSGGDVTFPKHARLGVLRQDRFLDDEQVVLDVAMMGDEVVWRALAEQDRLSREPDPDPERIGEIDEILNANDGYGLESRASQILTGLGLAESWLKRPLGTLSGGYKLRVLLAQVLVARADVILLDEPTNHLDILSIRWLERFLGGYRGCAVVISHDQRFLNTVATHILDVDYCAITLYPGNYDAFQKQKVATRVRREAEIAKVERAISERKAFIERFRAKASKARQAQSRAKQVERMEIERLPQSSRRYPKIRFEIERPSGKDVLAVEGVGKSYGDHRVLEGVSFRIRRGERVAVIGANGLGKSTLLEILTGNLGQDGGEVTWGHETRVGYFAQDQKKQLTEPKKSVHDYLWDFCPDQGTGFVRSVLGRLLFSRDEVQKRIESLSGGEATRLVLSRLVVQKPNVLVLDEPTNHLDLESIEALVTALEAYEGTLIFVSHDRWFVSRLASRILEIRADGIVDYPGSYDEYVATEGDDHLDVEQVVLRAKRERRARRKPKGGAAKRTRESAALSKRRDAVVARIEAVEARLSEIQALYCEPAFFERTPPEEVRALGREENDLGREQARLMGEWEAIELEFETFVED